MNAEPATGAAMILGLRTVIYHVPDLQRAKAWYSTAFGVQPYFDEPFYVGFNIGGYELGLDPDTKGVAPGAGGAVAYWGVPDVDAAATFHEIGSEPQGAGSGRRRRHSCGNDRRSVRQLGGPD